MEKGEEEELLKEFINGDPYLKVKFKEFIKELDKIDIIINIPIPQRICYQ